MNRHLRSLLVATLTAAAVATPAAAFAADGPATVTLEPLSAAGVPLTGPFTVKADVTMNTDPSVTVSVDVGYTAKPNSGATVMNDAGSTILAAQTVTAQDCPVTCTLTWTFDPTTQAAAWPDANVSAVATLNPGTATQSYSGRVVSTYQSPVSPFTAAAGPQATPTAITATYGPGVLDTTGTWTLTSPTPRTDGETVRATLRLPRSTQDAAVFTGTWGAPDPSTGAATGTVLLDVTALPAAGYELTVQAETASGHYGIPKYLGIVTVRHVPSLTGLTYGPFLAGNSVQLNVTSQGPYPTPGVNPTTVEVRVGTAAPVTFPVTFTDSLTSVTLPASMLPAGTTSVNVELLDQNGTPIGSSIDVPLVVVAFHETVTAAPLVVGVQSPVTIKGTAPAGLTFSVCGFAFYDPAGRNGYTSGVVCTDQKSFATTITTIPQAAGPGRFEVQVNTQENYLAAPVETFPTTVYADRSATYTAPTTGAYNAALSAIVNVADLVSTGQPRRAAANVPVTLQRKVAGTTTWTTIATARTDSTGKAALRFANTANGRLRALVASAVPGRTLTLPERSVTSVGTVSWFSLVSYARAFAPVTARVTAAPYEPGARIAVQVRRLGTTTWTTVATGNLGTTGGAAGTFKLTSRGTWQVRVGRYATTRIATGYTSIRTLTIS